MKLSSRHLAGTSSAVFAISSLLATAQESTVETVPVKTDDQSPQAQPAQAAEEAPAIQLALLLDTSGSMSGLIEQAKTQLWTVVNQFATAKQKGKAPVLQVSLYEYGKSSLPPASHWIRQIQPLTRDLDKLSEELFALRTQGGKEYCGAVISEAVTSLAWDASPQIYKAIFIAGNEPFTQGPVSPSEACKEAISRGIIVNTIHCGPEQAGTEGGWKQGALLADGSFMIIDQNQAVAHIEAPQDAEILKLNTGINDTYIPFGKAGAEGKLSQAGVDTRSKRIAQSNLVDRSVAKASASYFNARWDLADACQQKGFRWEDVKKEDLPQELRKLTTEELKAHVGKQIECRADLRKKILALSKERRAYVAEKQKELAEDNSLGEAVATAVRRQASAKGVTFGSEETNKQDSP